MQRTLASNGIVTFRVLGAYRNTPHESTGERPSFLVFGMDCRPPSEACLLPTSASRLSNLDDYRERMWDMSDLFIVRFMKTFQFLVR